MFITVGSKEYELKTTLGVAKALEDKTKKTLTEIMTELYKSATVADMLRMLTTALADKSSESTFNQEVLDNLDFLTIQKNCEALLLNITFGGTPEEQEKKIADFPASALRKNLMRRALNLPVPETDSTSEKSSEPATE